MGLDWRASLHVVFGQSAAGSIREALRSVGRLEGVIGCPDDLSFGPINPPDIDLRRDWAGTVLNLEYDEVASIADAFWTAATSADVLPVAWVCSTCAIEQAGFLEFVWRMADRSFDIVDATGIEVPTLRSPWQAFRPSSLGVILPEQIVASGLPDRQRPYSLDRASASTALWGELREQNAPFRVVKGGRLVSAPVTVFDTYLEQNASLDWQVAARLVGNTMWNLLNLAPDPQCVSDMVLFGRMIALGETGALDVEGSGPSMRDYRVRRPQGATT